MVWEKNGFSELIWILYLLGATAGLFCLAGSAAESLGWGGPYMLPAAGAAVLVLAVVLFVLLRLLVTSDWVRGLSEGHAAPVRQESPAKHGKHVKHVEHEKRTESGQYGESAKSGERGKGAEPGQRAELTESGKPSGGVPWSLVEGIAVVLLLAGALLLRLLVLFMPERFPVLYGIAAAGENSEYFQAARMAEGGSVPQVAHGAVYFYLQALHFCFFLLGNRWEVGIWLQIALQLFGALLVCIGVRKLVGAFPAVSVLAYLLFFPSNLRAGFTYSPEMLYLCFFGLGLLAAAAYFGLLSEGRLKNWYGLLFPLLVGIPAALLCYLDISGFALVFLLLGVFALERKASGRFWDKSILQFVLLLLSAAGFFIGLLALDAWSSGSSLPRIWNAWFSLYQGKGWNPLFWIPEKDLPGCVGIVVLMMLGGISFWRRNGSRRGIPWVLPLVSLWGMGAWQISTLRLGTSGLFWLVCVVLAADGLRDCLEPEMEEEEAGDRERQSMEEGGSASFGESRSGGPEPRKSALQKESQGVPAGGLQFIEDPFSRPRKPRKKPVGYVLEPEESQMHYDVEVAEDDDFDY